MVFSAIPSPPVCPPELSTWVQLGRTEQLLQKLPLHQELAQGDNPKKNRSTFQQCLPAAVLLTSEEKVQPTASKKAFGL